MLAGLEDAIRDPTQNVSLTVKPVVPPAGTNSSTSPQSPATSGGGTGQPPLSRNPQLVSTPSTVQADDVYTAKLAQARFKADTDYLSALRDIGFTNDAGQFIPGLIQTEAARRQQGYDEQYRLATEGVNNEAVRGGTFFSGHRAKNLVDAQNPINLAMLQNKEKATADVTDRYNDAINSLSGYTLTMDELLAELADRQSTRARNNPSGAIGGVTAPTRSTHVSTGTIGRGRF